MRLLAHLDSKRPLCLLMLAYLWAPVVCSAVAVAQQADGPQPESATYFQDTVRPALMKSCSECHDPHDEEDAVRFLRATTASEVAGSRGIWASVAEQLRNRTMPPADSPQPTEKERVGVASWIGKHLQATACDDGPYAGSPVARRLNRDQFTYAIKDLTGADFDFVQTLPADGSGGEGFDNNGETLFLPPILMERYLEVAQSVIDEVIVTKPMDTTYVASKSAESKTTDFELIPQSKPSQESAAKLQPGQSATMTLRVPTEDDFGLSVKAVHQSHDREDLLLSVDGIEIKTLPISRNENAEPKRTALHLSAGFHQIRFALPSDGVAMRIQWARLKQQTGDKNELRRREKFTKQLFTPAGDATDNDQELAAERILGAFARQAWRRPIRKDELEQLLRLYRRGRQRDESMAQAVKLPLKAVLVSPKFLFVTENQDPEQQGPEQQPASGGMNRVSDIELATRLSLFLWHSLPDETLLSLAEQNKLHNTKTLQEQVARMLADERSQRFAEAFAGQWLGTVAVGRTVIPDTNHFKPEYTSELVQDLRRQVTETMAYLLKENRPLSDWIDSDYVVVNKRLAKHYKIKNVPKSDERFEVVRLGDSKEDSRRAGVLGMGAVHMLTSYARRTSPVLRGGWVLETIFGVHLPAPPPDAGQLPGGDKETGKSTVRERLQAHRENPTCAACHDLIDPIGFALENFDVLGRWRDKEGKSKIDALGKLPSGTEFRGPAELRKVLLERQDEFLRQVSQRMLGYALGRSLEDADQCTVQQLAERLQRNDGRIHELILGIVESTPFQYRSLPQ